MEKYDLRERWDDDGRTDDVEDVIAAPKALEIRKIVYEVRFIGQMLRYNTVTRLREVALKKKARKPS